MIELDGASGEGGGQILRSALALSLCTGAPFRIANIRARRERPGLMRQHLTAVNAAIAVGDAEASGAELGSTELVFRPSLVKGGERTFSTGGAGSTTLVLQTVLLPLLLRASEPSTLILEGGTHNPMAPPFDFLDRAFLPLLKRMGADVEIAIERPGFYPAGGGRFTATIRPSTLQSLTLLDRGEIRVRSADAMVAQVPSSVAMRECETLGTALGWERSWCRPNVIRNSHGPGNVLTARVECEHVTEVFTGFGERGVRAEKVAQGVADEVRRYLAAGVPVFEHLADQLLLPMALGSGGAFRTVRPSLHTTSQIDLFRRFLDVSVATIEEAEDVFRVEI